jgi:cytochrome c oxidase assembly protein subunit 15
MKNYLRFAWFTLFYCVAVILWGAYVRASGSGAGCGAHWPLCNGQLNPRPERIQTWIEFSHRLSSGGSLILVLVLALWTLRLFRRKSFQRKAAAWSSVAIVMEALIGAVLVLARLVEHDKSIDRVFSISLHLVNTLLLLASLTVLILSASAKNPRWRWKEKAESRWANGLLAGFALLGAMGAMAALGDTLFPSTSLTAGFAADFDSRRHFLERIRIIHPLVAVTWAFLLWNWLAKKWQIHPELKNLGVTVMSLAAANITIGIVNILFLAPIPIQILHLFCANLLWISFVGFTYAAAGRQASFH